MPLDLVGKLHRTVYIEGCPSTVREDLLRLLVTKCGAIEGWDVTGERLIVVFRSMNSISTAITFNGTAFGDLTSKLFLWVATESPPAGVAQQLAIADGSGAARGGSRTAEELKSARERREKRLAAIRSELAPEIEIAQSMESDETRRLNLCVRQLKALGTLTSHALVEAEQKLEDISTHLGASQRLLESLRAKKLAKTMALSTGHADTPDTATATSAAADLPGVLGEREDVEESVKAMVAKAEDIGQWRKHSRGS
ncbi:hypothetical protein TraAM80_00357 [Trypanosoma rangeli]|uniref:RRM domain-containing protein n=1 Tax=Trypanosoma rangeli TaxID=5698 RepID=A0A422P3P4_TRYRA|nr:uncharacterized protein TraAM80_00357 [Trypanosoma rangeli]RNF12346.1 hypothetical protein TraAM80_00357 [Trypanosoma rangeli]|eukprot:RNF12346.1 hypothetical protein TraAM80_00357 [Trypanosoma rangeli]